MEAAATVAAVDIAVVDIAAVDIIASLTVNVSFVIFFLHLQRLTTIYFLSIFC
jgi:hypothetical protein